MTSRIDAMYPNCGPTCTQCGNLCKRGTAIDAHFAGRLAFMLECVILDPHGHFDAACQLLDEYKAEWEKVNPSPPTFMGEPITARNIVLLELVPISRTHLTGFFDVGRINFLTTFCSLLL